MLCLRGKGSQLGLSETQTALPSAGSGSELLLLTCYALIIFPACTALLLMCSGVENLRTCCVESDGPHLSGYILNLLLMVVLNFLHFSELLSKFLPPDVHFNNQEETGSKESWTHEE